MRNQIEYVVSGRRALFSDPVTRVGGEKCTYHLPTYQALKGITEAIYWKPTLIWVIDSVRIVNRIATQIVGAKTLVYNGSKPNDMSIYTYLTDVCYQVRAHFEWNQSRPDLAGDRNEDKHYQSVLRYLERGGKRDVFLGTRECAGYVEPCKFGSGVGAYDDQEHPLSYGMMFHSFVYPSESGQPKLITNLWNASMTRGVVEFVRPSECPYQREVKKMFIAQPGTIGCQVEQQYFGDEEVRS